MVSPLQGEECHHKNDVEVEHEILVNEQARKIIVENEAELNTVRDHLGEGLAGGSGFLCSVKLRHPGRGELGLESQDA